MNVLLWLFLLNIMKLQAFNGGLQTRLAPNLIDLNASVVYQNVNNEAGILEPIKDKTDINQAVNPYYYLYNSEWVSTTEATEFIEAHGNLYYGGAQPKKYDGTNTYNLGIVKPSSAPTTVVTESPSNNPPVSMTVTQDSGTDDYTLSSTDGTLEFPDGTYQYRCVIYSGPSQVVAIIDKSITVSSGLTDYITVTSPTNYFTNGFVDIYRYYGGAWKHLNTILTASTSLNDTVLDISGAATYALTVNNSALRQGTTYTYYLYNEIGGYLSEAFSVSATTSTTANTLYIHTISDFNGLNGTTKLFRGYGTDQKLLGTVTAVDDIIYDYKDNIADNTSLGNYPGLSGTYQYVVTYYNSGDGTESKPSPLTTEDDIILGSIALSSIPVSSDAQVDKKKIYRIGGTLLDFTEVAEITNATTTYDDSASDISLADNNVLASENNAEAPANLRYLTEAYGELFGAVGTKLYFTRGIGNFNYWADIYLEFPKTITGIGAVANGLLVFTMYKTYIVTGTSLATYAQYPLRNDQGCIEGRTVQGYGGSVLFVSTDGICISSGGATRILSKQKLGKLAKTPISAVIYNEAYYVQYNDGTTLVLDLAFGEIFKYRSYGVTDLSVFNDILYGYNSGQLYTLETASTDLTWEYTSPNIIEGSYTNHKLYNHIYIRSSGSVTIKVYINGIDEGSLVLTKSLTTTDTHDLSVPQGSQRGYSIQFELTGTGKVYEIEYSTVNRQNGR